MTEMLRSIGKLARRLPPHLVSIVVVLAGWEVVGYFELVNRLFLPRLSTIAKDLWDFTISGELFPHLAATGSAMLVGLIIAIVVGVPIGLAAGTSKYFDGLTSPWVNAFNSMPRSIVFSPLAMIIFGITQTGRVAVIFIGASIPIVVNVAAGARTVDGQLTEMGRSFGMGQLKRFRSITLPGTVPALFSGIRLAIGHALIAVTVAELYASREGIGHTLARSSSTYNIVRVWAMIVLLAILGLTLSTLAGRLERRFDAWRV